MFLCQVSTASEALSGDCLCTCPSVRMSVYAAVCPHMPAPSVCLSVFVFVCMCVTQCVWLWLCSCLLASHIQVHPLFKYVRSPSYGSMSRSVPDASLYAALRALPVSSATDEFTGSDLSNDTELHAYLASQLFGADVSGPDNSQNAQQCHNSLTWPAVPVLPATYRSEALSLFGDHAAMEYEDALSPFMLCDGECPVNTPTANSESQLVKSAASPSRQGAAVRQETGKRQKVNKSLAPEVHIHRKPTYPAHF